jgi:nucleoside-diphosphate-sugar epimerase
MTSKQIDFIVTGASGFIGEEISRFLLSNSQQVVCVTRNTQLNSLKYKNGIFVNSLSEVSNLYDFTICTLIHCAGISPIDNIFNVDMLEINVSLTKHASNFATENKISKFIFLSSINVYGKIIDSILTESSPRTNTNLYGISKYLSEQIIRDAFKKSDGMYGFLSIRLPGVVGANSKNNFLSKLRNNLIEKRPVTIWNKNGLFNNVVGINDLVRFIYFISTSNFNFDEIVNLASDVPMAISEFSNIIQKNYGKDSEVIFHEGTELPFIIDLKRASLLGFKSRSTVDVVDSFLSKL